MSENTTHKPTLEELEEASRKEQCSVAPVLRDVVTTASGVPPEVCDPVTVTDDAFAEPDAKAEPLIRDYGTPPDFTIGNDRVVRTCVAENNNDQDVRGADGVTEENMFTEDIIFLLIPELDTETLHRMSVFDGFPAVIATAVAYVRAGTEASGRVFLTYSSYVRIPRSQRITSGLPAFIIYSPARRNSSSLEHNPRLRIIGLPALPTASSKG